jgi:hypothetical protein
VPTREQGSVYPRARARAALAEIYGLMYPEPSSLECYTCTDTIQSSNQYIYGWIHVRVYVRTGIPICHTTRYSITSMRGTTCKL